jgi:hypothetical protein
MDANVIFKIFFTKKYIKIIYIFYVLKFIFNIKILKQFKNINFYKKQVRLQTQIIFNVRRCGKFLSQN